ncbi:MAG: hypothetical protein LBT91_00065 [Bifidobacteriaceae bacterium]|jgi:hypothetical protein|nr:hypothetical protein [Bifidobacteriaceae bacterium]
MVSEKIFIIPENVKGKAIKGSNKVVSVLKDYEKAAKSGVGKIVAETGALVSKHEKEITEFLYKTYGGNFVYRKVSSTEGQKISDIYWNGIAYDIKASAGVSKNAIDNRLRRTEGQSNRFIFDISNSRSSNTIIINQSVEVLSRDKRHWVGEIVLVRDKKVIDILRRKK